MQKDVEHFKGSEDLLNLVRANVTEASLVNETKDQVVKNKMVDAKMVNVLLISFDGICHKIQIPVFYVHAKVEILLPTTSSKVFPDMLEALESSQVPMTMRAKISNMRMVTW